MWIVYADAKGKINWRQAPDTPTVVEVPLETPPAHVIAEIEKENHRADEIRLPLEEQDGAD